MPRVGDRALTREAVKILCALAAARRTYRRTAGAGRLETERIAGIYDSRAWERLARLGYMGLAPRGWTITPEGYRWLRSSRLL